MVRRDYLQRSIFTVLLPDGAQLWEPELRTIDEVLDDEAVVDLVVTALGRRRPQSAVRGRPGTPATVVLRMLVLKHRYDWSFEECERLVRGSLVYRAFCRLDCERVPDAKTLCRLAQTLGADVLHAILERLVTLARQRRVIRGRRLRVDTTVVETTVHHPTDSSLLADGVRVVTRAVQRLRQTVGGGVTRFRDRTRSLGRRVFAIVQQSRTAGPSRPEGSSRLKRLYRQAMGITRAVVRDAETVCQQVMASPRRMASAVAPLVAHVQQTLPLVRRILAQTRARILTGDTHYPDKLLSVFEPHTEAIRKGKAAKPTEFGKVIKLQEAEAQFLTDYHVCGGRVPDQDLWLSSLETHRRLFGGMPQLAVADAGFASRVNERLAQALGVRHVALAPRGRGQAPRPPWFRRALRWRTGCEGRISVLKRRHGLRRCRYRGLHGMERWVGLGVIANNLVVLGQSGICRQAKP